SILEFEPEENGQISADNMIERMKHYISGETDLDGNTIGGIFSQMRNHIAQHAADPKSEAKAFHLGSASIVLENLGLMLDQMHDIDMTPEQAGLATAIGEEYQSFKEELDVIFTKKLKQYSLEEINAMSDIKKINILGSQIGAMGKKAGVLKLGGAKSNTDTSTDTDTDSDTETTSKTNSEIKQDNKEAIEDLEKRGSIAKSLGNGKAAKLIFIRLEGAKAEKHTIDSITEKDFFSDDKGLMRLTINFVRDNTRQEELKEFMKETTAFTKEFMVKRGLAADVDQISEDDIDTFLAKGSKTNVDPNYVPTEAEALQAQADLAVRQQYYAELKIEDMMSRNDINNKFASRTKSMKSIEKKIYDARIVKQSKMRSINNTLAGLEEEVRDLIAQWKANGIEAISTIEGKDGADIANPTDEQISESLRIVYDRDQRKFNEGGDNLNEFEINMKDVVDFVTNSGKADFKGRGVYKVEEAIIKEQGFLKGFKIDTINETIMMSKENYEAYKEAQNLKDNGELTPEKIKKLIRLRDALENALVSSNKSIDELGSTKEGITELQNQIIDILALEKGFSEESMKKYFDILNRAREKKNETKSLEKSIKKNEELLEEYAEERDNILQEVKDLNPNLAALDDLDVSKSATELKGVFTKILGLIKALIRGTKTILQEARKVNTKMVALEKAIAKDKDALKFKLQMQTALESSAKAIAQQNQINKKHRQAVDNAVNAKNKRITQRKKKLTEILKATNLKIRTPLESNRMLESQAKSVEDLPVINESTGIPNALNAYVETKKNITSLFSLIDIAGIDNKIINKYRKEMTEFIKTSGIFDAIFSKKVKNNLNVYAAAQSLLFNPASKEKDSSKPEINQSFVAALMIATNTVIRNGSKSITNKDDEMLATMLKLKESDITNAHRKAFGHLTRRKNFGNEIATEVLSLMDFKAKTDGDIHAYARFKASIGAIAIKYAIDSGMLIEENMKIADYKELVGKEGDIKETEAEINFLTRPIINKNGKAKGTKKDIPGLDPTQKAGQRAKFSKEYLAKFDEELTSLEMANGSTQKTDKNAKADDSLGLIPVSTKTAMFTRPRLRTEEEIEIPHNPVVAPTNSIAKAIIAFEQNMNEISESPTKTLFEIFSTDPEENRKAALEQIGWIDENELLENKALSQNYVETTIAANREKEGAYDELYLVYKKVFINKTHPNTLWFKWETAYNNRLNMASTLISPQTEKELHRFLISPANSTFDYTPAGILKAGEVGSDGRVDRTHEDLGVYFGIAQAFGVDIDKETPETTVIFAKKLMGIAITDAEFASVADLFEKNLKLTNNVAITSAQIKKRIQEGKVGKDHLGHLLQAFSFIEDFQAAYASSKTNVINGKQQFKPVSFRGTITAEYDGITNGTIIKTLQLPIDEFTGQIIFKGGIVVQGVDNSMEAKMPHPNKTLSEDEKNNITYQKGMTFEEFLDGNLGMLDAFGINKVDRAKAKEENYAGPEFGVVLDTYLTGAVGSELDADSVAERVEEQNAKNKQYAEKDIKSGKRKHAWNPAKENLDKFDLLSTGLLQQFIPSTDEILSNKELRDLFKYPTMIINYGGAIYSVVRSVAAETSNSLIDNILDGHYKEDGSDAKKAADQVLSLIAEKLYGTELVERKGIDGEPDTEQSPLDYLVQELHDTPLAYIKPKYDKKQAKGQLHYSQDVESILVDLMAPAVGEAVGNSIENIFRPLIETTDKINIMSRLIFRAFDQAFEQRLVKMIEDKKEEAIKAKAKGEEYWVQISQEDMENLIDELKPIFPIFLGPGSVDRIKDGIAIYNKGLIDMTSEDPIANQYSGESTPRVMWLSGKDIKSMNVQPFIDRLKESFASAGVIPTHTEDGFNMAETIIEILGEGRGVLGVHDAIVIGGKKSMESLQLINKNFITISKSYSMANAITDTAFEVMASMKKMEKEGYEFDMSSIIDEKETKKLEKLVDEESNAPQSYADLMYMMQETSENVWNHKERLFSHDMMVDQFPGAGSAYHYVATYDKERYEKELYARIKKRLGSDKIPGV
ncbi:MAG: hypothetical protein KAH01_08160, partial [Caldisericia bacterium]|nr:hypothetical protein [Caldisericia bacterium]